MIVKEARGLLGEEIENLSDDEVQQMIDRDLMFCDALLDVIMSLPKSALTNYEEQN